MAIQKVSAVAFIRGDDSHPKLCGKVRFLPRCGGTLVSVDVCGLPDSESGFFAFHIHEKGDCMGSGFSNTGAHYNPEEEGHPRHAGDLPPLLSCGGKAVMTFFTDRFSVGEIIGRSVVIHSGPDDFRTQPAGNAGEKIGCGVIFQV